MDDFEKSLSKNDKVGSDLSRRNLKMKQKHAPSLEDSVTLSPVSEEEAEIETISPNKPLFEMSDSSKSDPLFPDASEELTAEVYTSQVLEEESPEEEEKKAASIEESVASIESKKAPEAIKEAKSELSSLYKDKYHQDAWNVIEGSREKEMAKLSEEHQNNERKLAIGKVLKDLIKAGALIIAADRNIQGDLNLGSNEGAYQADMSRLREDLRSKQRLLQSKYGRAADLFASQESRERQLADRKERNELAATKQTESDAKQAVKEEARQEAKNLSNEDKNAMRATDNANKLGRYEADLAEAEAKQEEKWKKMSVSEKEALLVLGGMDEDEADDAIDDSVLGIGGGDVQEHADKVAEARKKLYSKGLFKPTPKPMLPVKKLSKVEEYDKRYKAGTLTPEAKEAWEKYLTKSGRADEIK